jgi:hypothetical protein
LSCILFEVLRKLPLENLPLLWPGAAVQRFDEGGLTRAEMKQNRASESLSLISTGSVLRYRQRIA